MQNGILEYHNYFASCMNKMDIRQLRAFLTIAETGNITKAAESLNLVQPAVSKQLRGLEEDVGAKLFERERHGMVLTDAGKSLQGYARRVMLELDRARAELSGSVNEVAGIVTVGLLPSISDLLVNSLVAAVARDYPRINIRIELAYVSTLQQGLESGEVDAAVLYGVENEPYIHARPLLSEPLWVIGPASARLNSKRPIRLDSLVGKPMILPNGPRGVRTLLDRFCAASNLKLNIRAETNALSVQKSLVLGGQGLTIGPLISFAPELASGLVTASPINEPGFLRTIGIAMPASRAPGRPVRHVVTILELCMKEAVQSGQWLNAHWLAD
jgi:LysR family transcriptional regulator, nitrogen assimilation regulatory protein